MASPHGEAQGTHYPKVSSRIQLESTQMDKRSEFLNCEHSDGDFDYGLLPALFNLVYVQETEVWVKSPGPAEVR